jgi:hypothetical protein
MRYPPWLESVLQLVRMPAAPPEPAVPSRAWDDEVGHWIPRALSLERQNVSNISLAADQEQSLFFTWLPLEIRLMIYEELFAQGTLHLYPVRGQDPGQAVFKHHQCHHQSGMTVSDELREVDKGDIFRACMTTTSLAFGSSFWPYPGGDMLASPHFNSSANVAVLRTCRRAYVEGIGLLYRHNRFDFAHPQALNWFVGTLLPHRLASISTLQIRLDLDWRTSEEPWKLMWTNIKEKMTGLEDLLVVVRLTFRGPKFKKQNESDSKRLLKLSKKCVPASVCKRFTIRYLLEVEDAEGDDVVLHA